MNQLGLLEGSLGLAGLAGATISAQSVIQSEKFSPLGLDATLGWRVLRLSFHWFPDTLLQFCHEELGGLAWVLRNPVIEKWAVVVGPCELLGVLYLTLLLA